MNVYFDGSWVPVSSETKTIVEGGDAAVFAWGLVFDHPSGLVESSGIRFVEHTKLNGTHEVQAFIECALYCLSHNIAPSEITFVTDDEVTVYGTQSTPENGCFFNAYSDVLNEMLTRLVQYDVYNEKTIESVRQFFRESRFVKIKGHARILWNLRCDVLATNAVKVFCKREVVPTSVQEWVKKGFKHTRIEHRDGGGRWFPAFSGMYV